MAYRKTTFFNRKFNIGLKTDLPNSVPINKLGAIAALKLTAVAVSVLSFSSNAAALGLGALEVQSNLDQPLNGVIELRLSDGDDINSIEALIASRDDFLSLGIDYPNYMGNINLTVDSSGGVSTLRVNSSDVVINEPFIHFLVRVNWAGGSFLREYTALIDPPVYGAETPRSLSEPKAVGTDQTYQVEEYEDIQVEELEEPVLADSDVFDELSEQDVVYEEDTIDFDEPAIEEAEPEEYLAEETDIETDVQTDVQTLEYEETAEAEPYIEEEAADEDYQVEAQSISTDAQYGPVASGESLSIIAQELQRQFPDLSIYQIMRVLFDENRNSFINENINGLMKGAVLNLGDLDAIRAVDIAEARNFFYQQVSEWDPSLLVASTDDSDDGLRVGQDEYNYEDLLGDTSGDSAAVSGSDLTDDTFQVGASTDTQSFVSASEGDNREGEVIALQQQITDLESSLSSSSLENQELVERISILEGQLTDMNRLLSLDVEDAELASIEATLADQNNNENDSGALQDDLVSQVDALLDDGSAVLGDEAVIVEDEFSEIIEDPSLSDGALDELASDFNDGSSEILDDALVEIDDGLESSDEVFELGDDTLNGSLEDALNDELIVEESDLVEPVAASSVNAAQPSFIEKIKTMIVDNGLWKLIAGIGGLLLVGLAAIVFRRKRADEEFEISMLSIETQSQSVTKSSTPSSDEEGEAKAGDRETSFLTVYSDSDAVVQADEVDPIAEADVYIAYGRDEQAEEVLLDGIASKPGRVDIKQKLLGLYHKNNNVEGFERIAEELYSQKSSLTSDLWQEVSLMGMDIAPNNPLFAVSVAELLSVNDDQAEPAETAISDPVNVQDEVEEVTIEDASEAIDMALAEDDESINLINFDDGRSEVSELDRVEIDALDLDDDESIDDDYRDDFNSPNLDSDVGDEKTVFDKSDEVLVTVLADDVLDEKVDLDDVIEFDAGDAEPEVDQGSKDNDIEVLSNDSIADIDITDDMSLEPVEDDVLELDSIDASSDSDRDADEDSAVDIQLIDEVTMTHEVSGLEIDDQYNEAKTQFELAKVFVDLGDQEGAKKILDDIIANNDNDDDVVEDAIELLDSLES